MTSPGRCGDVACVPHFPVPRGLLPATACLLLLSGCARKDAAVAQWPEYLGGPDRSHYSPLDQINRSNVGRLKVAWEYHTGDPGQMQCNPIVVDGVLYAATAHSQIFALDAASGRELWRFHHEHEFDDLQNDRGVAFWTDGTDRRILCTVGSWLYALDARTGKEITTFGVDGRVSLKSGLGAQAQDKWVVSTTPGTVYGDLIVMPTRVGEDADAAPGYIQAFNVRTGTVAWVFHTMPYPTEPGYETWVSKEAYKNIDVGSGNNWCGMAIDRARGILYVPTGSIAPDFWGGHRLGPDLYANCLLALDAATGKLLWFHQTVHHDIWDKDLPAPPVLATLMHDGHPVDAVVQTTKTGFVFAYNRVTGDSLFPVHEVPVPPSELKGEEAWPTQPVPELPKPYARQGLTDDEVSPYAENRAELLERLHKARKAIFTPLGFSYEVALLPGFDGGGEWGGPAMDPKGILYVNANEMAWMASMGDLPKDADLRQMTPGHRLYAQYCIACHGLNRQGLPSGGIPSLVEVGKRHTRAEIVAQIAKGKAMMPGFPMISDEDRDTIASYLLGEEKLDGQARIMDALPPHYPYLFKGYNRWVDSKGLPAISPPWGTLTAIDMNTGAQLWRVPLGEFRQLSAKGIPPTGCENYGGPVATAGGLVFIAATKDGMMRAFDQKTGEVVWKTDLPAAGFATPATYMAGGRQYLVVACGGEKLDTAKGDSYVAFALPQ